MGGFCHFDSYFLEGIAVHSLYTFRTLCVIFVF